jgi:FtsP/CotA-like multicopper oxidase with cupredoxin domain
LDDDPAWSAGKDIGAPRLIALRCTLLPSGQQVACDFDADNSGQRMTHCHNLYHAPESGMMAVLGYQA